ncbi:hypothetical protein [Sphingomonas sp. RS2018]
MRRFSILLLEVALLLSAILAVMYLVRVIASWFLPLDWYWGGALVAVGAAPLIALALRLLDKHPVSSEVTTHA